MLKKITVLQRTILSRSRQFPSHKISMLESTLLLFFRLFQFCSEDFPRSSVFLWLFGLPFQ
jgi:hypothetical protein